MNVKEKKISIIIPSYNTKEFISKCLESLKNQCIEKNCEVIVVDSSDDNTHLIIVNHFPWVRLIHLPNRTLPGLARNIGIEQAQGEILLFTDADCIPSDNWVELMVKRQESADVVIGGIKNGSKKLGGFADYFSEFSELATSDSKPNATNGTTSNFSCKKYIFERYLKFPTDFWPGEDRVFFWEVARHTNVFFDPNIFVYHLGRESIKRFLNHQRRLGETSCIARKKTNLPGAVLVKFPLLRLLSPGIRLWNITLRLLKAIKKNLSINEIIKYVLAYPLIVLGALFWGYGFMRGKQQYE